MKIKFLLIGTSLSFLPQLVYAQCVATQDCETLGYTETSCNGGKGVKCPFGNKWACLASKEDVCREEGFIESCTGAGQSGSGKSCGGFYAECSCASTYQYSCTGTGYAGGAGSACGGKYTQCACASGYEWKNGSCQKKEILTGADGNVYKCNGKVVGVKVQGINFYVSMKDLGKMSWSSANNSCQNYSFCGNLKGTLPTVEQQLMMYNNKSSLEILLTSNGGKEFSKDTWYWTSTINGNNNNHTAVEMNGGGYDWGHSEKTNFYARPVLTSW